VAVVRSIRDARPDEASALEALQRRSSDVWEEYRAQLAASPDAIEPPLRAIADGRVRVAVDACGPLLGFSVVLPVRGGRCELDDLFVEPDSMGLGVGRLLVDDLVTRAAVTGATHVDVIANPNAVGFYERFGFEHTGRAPTRFGDAPRMSLALILSPRPRPDAPRARRAPSSERGGGGLADCPR
jgi:GNAT superfamily N-acetyltransferase